MKESMHMRASKDSTVNAGAPNRVDSLRPQSHAPQQQIGTRDLTNVYEILRAGLLGPRRPLPQRTALLEPSKQSQRRGLGCFGCKPKATFNYLEPSLPVPNMDDPHPWGPVEVLHRHPFVARIPAVFTAELCARLRDIGQDSSDFWEVSGCCGYRSGLRTVRIAKDLSNEASRRMADVAGFSHQVGTAMTLNQYRSGGRFGRHFDWSVPKSFATLIVYLNTPESGGETYFPSLHLSVQPTQGSGLLFVHADADGAIDLSTIHQGLPVKGEKWYTQRVFRASV